MGDDIMGTGRDLSIKTKVTLNNGVEMPIFGLGTYQAGGGKPVRDAVLHALQAGYRLIDTAMIYRNEREVGEAVRKSGISRDEIFVTTKLWNADHGYDSTLVACEKSLKRLGLSNIDLYLIHWPVGGLRNETWKAMEELLAKGKCRSVGVSNYMERHLDELLNNSTIVPAVNQVEFSPYLYTTELLGYCRLRGIQFESYSPLTQGERLEEPKLKAIASKYSKTSAQLLIRWALQHDIVVIPKSTNKKRILENADVFDFVISKEDMKELNSLNEELHTSWDPTDAP
jgi:diketogulonate reductase-like aldo/keto reductase